MGVGGVEPMNYHRQGYNGYIDGIWGNTIVAMAQLQITNNAEASRQFMRGWNEAVMEMNDLCLNK